MISEQKQQGSSSSSNSGGIASASSTSTRKPQKRYLHNYGGYSSIYTNPIALWAEKWRRRAISMSMILLVLVVLTALFPLLALVALAFDAVLYKKRGGLNYVRVLSFFEVYLVIELIAIISNFIIYIVYMVSLIVDFDKDKTRWTKWCYWYQSWWGGTMLFGWLALTLGLEPHIELVGNKDIKGFEGKFTSSTKKRLAESLGIGPKIVFLRHASFADTLVPQGIFSYYFNMRYIVKKELLWDPALDISGSRTKNFFLFRDAGTEGMDVEMDAIKAMVSDFKPKVPSVTCIWPEGTRFTKSKREKVLESFKKKGDTRSFDFASKLKHTLMPRVGGALTLLDSNPCGDVIFCTHYGLEASSNFAQMMKGELCNRKVHIRFEQVKFNDIPKSKQERIEWLLSKWVEIDRWIEEKEIEFKSEKKKKTN